MNNTDEVNFWIFGQARIPKLAIIGFMFGTGLILGFLLGRPKTKKQQLISTDPNNFTSNATEDKRDGLSDEDREYIR